jgi:hypothetical protein
MPKGYTFVPKGDVYITRKCRLMTKDSDQVVYKVYVSAQPPLTLCFHPQHVVSLILLGQNGQAFPRNSRAL